MARGTWKAHRRLKGEVARLAQAHKTVPEIVDELDAIAVRLDIEARPGVKTIRKWVAEVRTSDTSGAWVPLAAEDPGQPARVLPVLAEAIRSGGEKAWLTNDQAALVDRVVLAKPTIPPRWAWALGLGYQWARANLDNTRGLDLTLALQPWTTMLAATDWADGLREMGERAGGWPGGGPGLLALAADEMPPPDWANKGYWSAQLWQILIGEGTNALTMDDGEPADSKLTAEPMDEDGRSETQGNLNRHKGGENGLG